PPALADKAPRAHPVGYICRGSTCSAPLETLAALLAEVRADRLPPSASRHVPDTALSGQQLDVAADGGGVDGERALGGEAQQVMRPSGLGSGARQALAAERLYPDHRADHVAVHVRVAHGQRLEHVPGDALEAAVNPERQPEAGAADRLEHPRQIAAAIARHVQDRSELLAAQLIEAAQ